MRFIPWEQLSLFFSRVFTLQSSLFGYSTHQDLDSAYAELFFAVGMASKQKYKSLSVKQKLEILERLDHLPAHKKKDIAAEFGIPCSTLSTILKNKETLKRQHVLGSSKKFRLKESTKPDVDTALFQSFTWNSDNSIFLLIQSFCWDIEVQIMWTTLYYE